MGSKRSRPLRRLYVKALALSLLAIILLSHTQNVSTLLAASENPSQYIVNNFELVALFLYRGQTYPAIGQYMDPVITIVDHNGKRSEMRYSEYVKKIIDKEIKIKWAITGESEDGDLLSFEFEQDIPPIFLIGGSYITDHSKPTGSFVHVEGDLTIVQGNTETASSVFFANPQYLYSFMRLTNNSRLVVPKGENVVLMLLPKSVGASGRDSIYDLLEVFLSKNNKSRTKCHYIGARDIVDRISSPDDPLSRFLVLSWTVEGRAGGLAYTAIRNVSVSPPSTIGVMVSGLTPAPKRGPITIKYDASFTASWSIYLQSNSNTAVFAPASYPIPGIVNYLEPVNEICSGPRARIMASKLSTMFIIKPDVYSGSDKVTLSISNARGMSLASFQINIEVGSERFSGIEAQLDGAYTSSKKTSSESSTITGLHKLSIEKKGYDEFGSLKLMIKHSGVQMTQNTRISTRYGGLTDTTDQSESLSFTGSTELRIGGWLPNPPPPGYILQVPEITYKINANSQYARSHWETLIIDIRCGVTEKLTSSIGSDEKITKIHGGEDPCGGFKPIYGGQNVLLLDTSSYSGENLETRQALIQLSPNPYIILTTPENQYFYFAVGELSTSKSSRYYFTPTTVKYNEFFSTPAYRVPQNGNKVFQEVKAFQSVHPSRASYAIAEVTKCSTTPSGNVTCSSRNITIVYQAWIYSRIDYIVTIFDTKTEPEYYILYLPKSFSGTAPSIGSPEKPVLALWFEKESAFPGDTLSVYMHRYGGSGKSVSVYLNATLSLPNGREILLNVTPSRTKISTTDTGIAMIKIPSAKELQQIAGTNLSNTPLVLVVKGVDEEGATGRAMAWIYGAGVYIVLNFIDIPIPLPDNPQESNVLEYIEKNYMSLGFEKETPLKGGDYTIELRILEKRTGKELYRTEINQGRLMLSPLAINMTPNETYILSYKLKINNYEQAPVYVRDTGVDIVVTEEMLYKKTDEAVKLEYKIPVPYTILKRYLYYAEILAGKNDEYAAQLTDLALTLEPITLLENIIASKPVPEDLRVAKDLFLGIISWIKEVGSKSFYARPVVLFPTMWEDSSIRTELSKLGAGISFRDPRYNLTSEAVMKDEKSYWSKLAKLVIFQAEMIRNHKYVTNGILIVSSIAAMAIVAESLEDGYFSKVKIWNRGNIMEKLKKPEWLDKSITKIFKVAKSTTILLDGSVLGTLEMLGYSGVRNLTLNLAGNDTKVADDLMTAITIGSKLIKFLLTAPTGELVKDVTGEIITQLLTTAIAQAMMALNNMALQHRVFQEVMISPYPLYPTETLLAIIRGTGIALYYKNLDFEDIASKLPSRTKPPELQWHVREDRYGVLDSAIRFRDLESLFYNIADKYMVAENVVGTVLSLAKELDSLVETIKGEGLTLPAGYKTVKKQFAVFTGLSLEYSGEVTIKETKKYAKLKDLVNSLYIATAAATIMDILIKDLWISVFYYTLTTGNKLGEFLTITSISLQTLLPIVTFVFTASKTIKKISFSQEDLGWGWVSPSTSFLEAPAPVTLQLSLISTGEISREMESLVAEAEALAGRFRGMVDRFQYNLTEIAMLVEILDRADLLMRRAMLSTPDDQVRMNLTMISAYFTEHYYDFTEVVKFLLMFPSIRPIDPLIQVIDSRIENIIQDLREARDTISRSAVWRTPPGAALVIRDLDIDTSQLWSDKSVKITVHNMGGESAKVSLAILDTELYKGSRSDSIEIPSGGSYAFTLKVEIPSDLKRDLVFILAILVNNIPVDQIIFKAYYTESDYNTTRGDGVETVSDGKISIAGNQLRLENVSILQLILPGGSSYMLKLNGVQIRSGEIHMGDKVIVGAVFSDPVSGVLTYEPVRLDTKHLKGSGETKANDWLTISSSGEHEVSLTVYETNPANYTSPQGVKVLKVFAIDVLRADAGSVTIRINYEKLGITDPSSIRILKYSVTRDAYIEVENIEIDLERKEVVITVTPGDPLFAIGLSTEGAPRSPPRTVTATKTASPTQTQIQITPKSTQTTETTTEAQQTTKAGVETPSINPMLVVVAVIAIVAIIAMYMAWKRKK
ncbi:MAG: hypothetical protein QXX84_03110 [Sulfolobales archaeon]